MHRVPLRGMKPKKKKVKRLSAELPVEDFNALQLEAEANGRSIASEARIAVANHLKAVGRRAA